MRILILVLLLVFSGCTHRKVEINKLDSDAFVMDSKVLKDEVYYFGSKKHNSSDVKYQALRRFDLIFVGHDINASSRQYNKLQNLAALIPGTYTHVLSYIGKDKDGFAYAVEMNADKEQSFELDSQGVKLGGRLYFYCLGSDFGEKSCPKSNYEHGIKSYDYMWAKRVKLDIKKYEKQLLKTIKKDYLEKHPFQIPLDFSLKTQETKVISILDDGRKNGSSCAGYFVSLFEKVAGLCMDDVRINAKNLKDYYLHDEIGKKAVVPLKYSVFFNKTIRLKEVFGKLGYSLVDNKPRETKCKELVGIVTPDLLFHSSQMIDIDTIIK